MNEQLKKDIADWQLKTDVLLTDSSESSSVTTQDFINLINEARTLLLRATPDPKADICKGCDQPISELDCRAGNRHASCI